MKKTFTLLIIQFLGLFLFGQNTAEQTGRILSTDKQGIAGVTILIKNTLVGTVSDENGFFKVKADQGQILVFSYLGYETTEWLIENDEPLKIILKENNAYLEEVVITALGIKSKTRNLSYGVQKLDAEEISTVKAANFLDNLNGKLAGITVTQGATGVGSSSKITIRGEASFTNNNPLFVVDGMPINNNTIVPVTNDAAAGFQEVDFGNGAMEVNPDDIASVQVLKGPAAAALYGTRASNGVILITTKDGSEQQGTRVSLNSTVFMEQAARLPEFQNKYGQGNSGDFEFVDGLGGGLNDNISYSWGPALDEGLLIPQFDSPVPLPDGRVVRGGDLAVTGGATIPGSPFIAHPDNLKDFYQTGYTAINNISVSSGLTNGSYRLSFTDLRSESIIPGVDLNRNTYGASLNFFPTEKLKITSSLSYVRSNSENRPSNGYGSENVNYSLVAWGPRSLDINALQDYWQPGFEGVQQYSFNYTFFDNPYFILNENRNSFNRNRLFGNIKATYFITDKLNVAFRTGLDFSAEERQFRRNFSTNRFINGGYAVHNVDYLERNTDILINYQDQKGDFTFDLYAGGNRLDQTASTQQSQALSLAQPGIFRLSNAASPVETFDFLVEKKINSLYGIAKVGYKGFLFFESTLRNDWSSALATPTSTDNISFMYPSLGLGFVASELLDLPTAINFLKLRGSWARVGNDTNPYQTSGAFLAQTPYNSQPTFSDQSTIPNVNLLPERTTSVEFGVDIRLLNNKVNFEATYYNALTDNQIITLPSPISSGYNARVVNGSQVRSKGVEVIMGITPVSGQFKWNTTFNFSRNITTVASLPDEVDRLTLAYSRIYDNVNQTVFYQVEEGGRIGDMYGTGYLRNEDGDFVIGDNGLYVADNRLQKLGNYNPDFTLGIQNNFHYKNWDFSFLVDWRQGGQLVSRTLALGAVGGQLEETLNRPTEGIVANGVVNIGTDENPVYEKNTQAVSAEAFYRNFYDRNHEENNTYDASYVKLRELSLSYTFDNFADKYIDQLNISLIGRNLLIFSHTPHFDPETLAVQGQQFVNGVEDMSYASTRSIGLKIGVQF